MPFYKLPNVDPVCLDTLLDLVCAHSTASVEALGNGILHLSSVTHCLPVKEAFAKRPEAADAVAKLLWNSSLVSIQFELLMILGELCRKEDLKEAAAKPDWAAEIQRTNGIARFFALHFATLGWFHDLLLEIKSAGQKNKAQGNAGTLAGDLLEALPPASANVAAAEKAWTAAAQEKTVDLMFLDERYRLLEYAPFVVRAVPTTCSNCNKKSDTAAAAAEPLSRCAQCKAAFYCSTECQKAHWKAAHAVPCKALKKGLDDGFKRVEGSAAAFSLFYFENRAFLFMQRAEMHQGMSFDDYFMQITAK